MDLSNESENVIHLESSFVPNSFTKPQKEDHLDESPNLSPPDRVDLPFPLQRSDANFTTFEFKPNRSHANDFPGFLLLSNTNDHPQEKNADLFQENNTKILNVNGLSNSEFECQKNPDEFSVEADRSVAITTNRNIKNDSNDPSLLRKKAHLLLKRLKRQNLRKSVTTLKIHLENIRKVRDAVLNYSQLFWTLSSKNSTQKKWYVEDGHTSPTFSSSSTSDNFSKTSGLKGEFAGTSDTVGDNVENTTCSGLQDCESNENPNIITQSTEFNHTTFDIFENLRNLFYDSTKEFTLSESQVAYLHSRLEELSEKINRLKNKNLLRINNLHFKIIESIQNIKFFMYNNLMLGSQELSNKIESLMNLINYKISNERNQIWIELKSLQNELNFLFSQ